MNGQRPDIAVVGMACVFPGAADLHAYWNNILAKVDAVSDPPPDWGADLFYDPDSEENDRTYCKRGGWLGDLAAFDPIELGVMPKAVDGGEPDHFLALKAAQDALQDAGYDEGLLARYKERSEVIIGRGTYVNRGNATALQQVVGVESLLRVLKKLHPEYDDAELAQIRAELKAGLPAFNSDTSAALVPNIITGRITNRLDMMGANYIVDAACASSLVAVDHAVRDLQTGRCDLAIAGGVHASTPPVILVIFSHLKALARSGKIRPFDARADGTLLGEGVGMVVLKRLEDAERDCDRIYSVVKGVGISSDGKALGLLAPRLEGEVLAIERAYQTAGVSVGAVGLVEAHGTGTLVGDATELEALETAFGRRVGALPDIALGSVKSMISHTMPASGIAGLIKTSLALHHKVLPPTICEEPHSRLSDPDTRFYLNTEARPWVHGDIRTPRRAGINAFGFGGINAHAVLEEYRGDHPAPWLQTAWDSELFVLSGRSTADVSGAARHLLDNLAASPELPLRHLAWRTNCSQELQTERLAIVATSHEDLADKLRQSIEKLERPGVERIKLRGGVYYFSRPLLNEGRLALVFPGEGAQYPNMLRDLCLHFPEVREVFELVDRAFQNHPRSRLPSQVVFPPPGQEGDAELIWSMDAGAEAVFCANQAVLRLLQELAIRPDAVVGHSTGEHSALLAAGIVRPAGDEEFIEHVLGVNQVFENLKSKIPDATLVAVAGAARTELEKFVAEHEGQLFIALDNCVNQVVLCGTEESVEKLVARLSGGSTICQRLPMARAYHTPWFRVFSDPLRSYFDGVPVKAPRVPIYSCVTAEVFPNNPDAIRDLIAVSWASTVRFRDTVEKMYADGIRVFVETGPRGNLSGFVGDILRGREHLALPADIRTRSGLSQMHHMLAQLVAHGANPNLEYLYRRRAAEIAPELKSGRLLRIATGLQPMQLRDERKPAPKPVAAAAPTKSAQPASNGGYAPVSIPVPDRTAAGMIGGDGETREPRTSAMEAHLRSMERFLETQQQVVSGYLARRGHAAAVTEAARAAAPAALPFVDRIIENDGRSARAVRRLSLNRDRLFADHTLGRDISADDPSLLALSVVPLAVTLEILAEAAGILAPGLACVAMRDVQASQWIVFDEPEIDLELEVETLAEGEVRVRVRRAAAPGVLRSALAEAVVLFADRLPEAAARASRISAERPSAWREDELYRKGMFHGSSFQAVDCMIAVGSDGCRARLKALPREGLIEGCPEPAFSIDPVILDAAGQVVAFWSQEVLQPCADIFPYQLDRLECFQPPPSPGVSLECNVSLTRIEERTLASDIEITDPDGRLVYRLTNWVDRRFSPPRGFWDLRVAPRQTFLSTPADDWLGPISDDPELCCVVLEAFPEEFYEASHGVWRRTLSSIVLSRKERRFFASLKATPARQREWITGRIAAKDAVRRLLQNKFGSLPAYPDIGIEADENGRISASGAWRERLGAAPGVSLSHSNGVAVALACLDENQAVGVDLEPIERDPREFEALAFTSGERQMLADLGEPDRRLWSLRLWCAKESVGKAMGTGLRDGPHSIEASAIDRPAGAVVVSARNGGTRYIGYTSLKDGFIFAVAKELGTK